MKSNKIKKYILIVLISILIIIWVKNISVIEKQSDFYLLKTSDAKITSKADRQSIKIGYLKPQLNPFSIPKPAEPNKESKQKPRKGEPEKISKISDRYRIDGIVTEKDNPQAILRIGEGPGIMISIGDTLDGWQVNKIESEFIIFSQEKNRDTLFLPIK